MKRLFFCGIGGIGMSALAQWCQHRGESVRGSDGAPSSITQALEDRGICVSLVQQADNVTEDLDAFIYTEAISEDHPERVRAQELGIPQKTYAAYLGEVSQNYTTIAVAGSHGKSTTTAMLGHALLGGGLDPTVLVGALVAGEGFEGNNIHLGTEDLFVAEACEYRRNFRYLHPKIVVLTNIEWDHPDSFPDESSYLQAFSDFCKNAETIVTHEETKAQLPPSLQEKCVVPDPSDYEIVLTHLPGEHNRENAALCRVVGQLLADRSRQYAVGSRGMEDALTNFPGLSRRQEYIGEYAGRPCFDDYGHHPTEIRSTLQAFGERFPDREIALVFQPHQFSRTKHFLSDFKEALSLADHTALLPIYRVRDTEADVASVTITDLAEDGFTIMVDLPTSLPDFVQTLPKKSVLVFMGAGTISSLVRDFLTHAAG